MLNSLSPVSGRILCTATAEVLSGSQVKTAPPIVNSQLVFHTPIFFDMKFLFLYPWEAPLNVRPLRKKMLVFFLFFLRLLVLGFGETRMVYNGDILLLAAVMG